MDRFQGLIGIVLILMIAFLFSNNKKRINYRLVLSGLALQLTIGILILKIPAITSPKKKTQGFNSPRCHKMAKNPMANKADHPKTVGP